MATKTYDIKTAESLIAGTESAPCVKCGQSNWAKAQPTRQTKTVGMLSVRCKVCAYKASNDRYATDAAYREYQKAYRKERWASDDAFRVAKSAYHKDLRANDPKFRAAQNERNLAWQKKNPGKGNARNAKYRATKLRQTPPWSETDLIREFYVNCPEGYHVDHIVPLQGELVSGLHVAYNLQYLPASENLSKSNKHTI